MSTGLALLISLGLSSIKPLRDLYQTIYFLPYVTNTLAVGLVFMILFQPTEYTDGLVNMVIEFFGGSAVDFYRRALLGQNVCPVLLYGLDCFTLKILVLTSALASVNPDYYKAPG